MSCICKQCNKPFETEHAFQAHECVKAARKLTIEELSRRLGINTDGTPIKSEDK